MEKAAEKANRREKATATAGLLHAYLDDGDITARNRLIELYLPLVESLAHRYERTEDYDDLLMLASAFEVLNERERQIVYLRFVRDKSRTEVAQELGISARHLSRQTQVALSKLREQLERAGQATAATSERPGTAAAGAGRRSSRASRGEIPPASRKARRRDEPRDGVVGGDRTGVVRNHRGLPYHVLV